MTLAEHFWSKVDKSGECWLWTGRRLPEPFDYGGFSHEGVSYAAHRLSWELTNGPIPYGLWVLHRCDNPPCVRPDHLFLGTRQDNVDDMVAKERTLSELSSNEVICMRERRAQGISLELLAAEYGVQIAEVSRICSGLRWSHIPIPVEIKTQINALALTQGERSKNAKLTADDVRYIHREYNLGRTVMSLAKHFAVDHKTVRNVVNGKKWKHISMEVLR